MMLKSPHRGFLRILPFPIVMQNLLAFVFAILLQYLNRRLKFLQARLVMLDQLVIIADFPLLIRLLYSSI